MRRELDFVGKRKFFITLSLILVVISVISFYTKGFNLGVEFTGGSEIIVKVSSTDVTEADIRKAIKGIAPEFDKARVTRVRSAADEPNITKFSIVVGRIYAVHAPEEVAKKVYEIVKGSDTPEKNLTSYLSGVLNGKTDEVVNAILKLNLKNLDEAEAVEKLSTLLKSYMTESQKESIIREIESAIKEKTGATAEIVSFSEISGSAAEEIRRGTFTAIVVAIIAILIYITFRFNFVFGLGAIIALVHDVVITLGFFSFFNYEMNVPAVAALLTLIGYSLNDTIVVYDRIRENMRKFRKMEVERLVNKSINEVIIRSINTSLTTFFVVFVLLLFAGKTIKPFAFGMTIGTIVGTYSSLYIAAPVVIKWVKRY